MEKTKKNFLQTESFQFFKKVKSFFWKIKSSDFSKKQKEAADCNWLLNITSKKEYEEALNRVDEIWDNPKKIDELELISILIEKYENEHYKIDATF